MKLPVSLLDLRVGARLLAKYPALTVVAGLAIAFAICVGAAGYEMVRQMSRPDLPLP